MPMPIWRTQSEFSGNLLHPNACGMPHATCHTSTQRPFFGALTEIILSDCVYKPVLLDCPELPLVINAIRRTIVRHAKRPATGPFSHAAGVAITTIAICGWGHGDRLTLRHGHREPRPDQPRPDNFVVRVYNSNDQLPCTRIC